jgi:hypothetical protein
VTAQPLASQPQEARSRTRRARDPKATEGELLDLLELSLARPGNGGSGEYAFLRQVRNAAGFDASRTFDAVAVGLWPSRGFAIHVYEVKVDRGDWQRELANPAKAEDAARVGDRFSIVAPRDVVDLAEVPATWGLIHATGGTEIVEEGPPDCDGALPVPVRRVEGRKLRTVRAAPLLRPAEDCRGPVPRSFLVPLLRAAGAVPDPVPASKRQIAKAVYEAVQKDRERARTELEIERRDAREQLRTLAAFKTLSGVHLTPENVKERAAAVRAAMSAHAVPESSLRTMRALLGELTTTTNVVRRQIEAMEGKTSDDQGN